MDTLIFMVGRPFSACLWTGIARRGRHTGPLGLTNGTWGTFGAALAGSGVALMLFAMAAFFWMLMQFFGPIASLRLALGGSVTGALSPGGMLRRHPQRLVLLLAAVGRHPRARRDALLDGPNRLPAADFAQLPVQVSCSWSGQRAGAVRAGYLAQLDA